MTNHFKRFEKKYIVSNIQYELLMHFIKGRMEEDQRTGYTISNLYYDTDNYDLIRASIEKPVYKEKIRIRTYDSPGINTSAYIELKKKVEGIVYKRRFKTDMLTALAFLGGGLCPVAKPVEEHTVKEIMYFLSNNKVSPKALITYERKALHGIEDPDFRMTFDSHLAYTNMDEDWTDKIIEKPVIEPEKMVMEIKTTSSIPIWLSKILSDLSIYPTSFSKYGVAYKTYVASQMFLTKNDIYSMKSEGEVILSA